MILLKKNKIITQKVNINYKSNTNIIWVNENIDNKENMIIANKLENIFKNTKLRLFKRIDDSIIILNLLGIKKSRL